MIGGWLFVSAHTFFTCVFHQRIHYHAWLTLVAVLTSDHIYDCSAQKPAIELSRCYTLDYSTHICTLCYEVVTHFSCNAHTISFDAWELHIFCGIGDPNRRIAQLSCAQDDSPGMNKLKVDPCKAGFVQLSYLWIFKCWIYFWGGSLTVIRILSVSFFTTPYHIFKYSINSSRPQNSTSESKLTEILR